MFNSLECYEEQTVGKKTNGQHNHPNNLVLETCSSSTRYFQILSAPRTPTSPPKELTGSLRFVYICVCVCLNTYTHKYTHTAGT